MGGLKAGDNDMSDSALGCHAVCLDKAHDDVSLPFRSRLSMIFREEPNFVVPLMVCLSIISHCLLPDNQVIKKIVIIFALVFYSHLFVALKNNAIFYAFEAPVREHMVLIVRS